MYKQILKSLKTKYKSMGLDESYLKVVAKRIAKTVKEESEIEEAVNDVSDELALAQSQADQARTMKKQLDELKKLLEAKDEGGQDPKENPKKEPEEGGNPKPNDGENKVPEWAKALSVTVKSLSKDLNDLHAEKANQTNKQKLLNELKELGVKESFYKFHIKDKTFENDSDITEFASSLKESQEDFLQENADEDIAGVSNPLHADSKTQKGVSSAAQAFINLNNPKNEQA